jgi:hypothetical protein
MALNMADIFPLGTDNLVGFNTQMTRLLPSVPFFLMFSHSTMRERKAAFSGLGWTWVSKPSILCSFFWFISFLA